MARSTPGKKTSKPPAQKAPRRSRVATATEAQAQEGDDTVAVGSQAAFERYLPAASAVEPAKIIAYPGFAQLAYHNTRQGLAAIQPHVDRLRVELPALPLVEVLSLDQLCLAVLFSVFQAELMVAASTGAAAAPLARARALRKLLLAAADMLVRAGLLPAREVQKIRQGRGPIDTAEDCVALSALFLRNAPVIRTRTAVTLEEVREAGELGATLLAVLRPRGARVRLPEASQQAIDVRNRLWSLLVLGHRELRRAGMWLWVEEVDQYVPQLLTRQVARRRDEEETDDPAPEEVTPAA